MRCWKGNEHWMVRDRDSDPDHDPERHVGCASCGWYDEDADIEGSDLIWVPADESGPGAWLCMECD